MFVCEIALGEKWKIILENCSGAWAAAEFYRKAVWEDKGYAENMIKLYTKVDIA